MFYNYLKTITDNICAIQLTNHLPGMYDSTVQLELPILTSISSLFTPKSVPAIVISVPPCVGPEEGNTDLQMERTSVTHLALT